MSQIRTRRKERVTVIHLLALLSVAALMSTASGEPSWPKCFIGKELSQKRHLGIGEQKNITLEVSSRITHQLATHIYRIFLEEFLGYTGVKIIENDDYDADNIIKRFNCFENKKDTVVGVQPESTINLEVPVPPDFTAQEIEIRCAYDIGTITPPGHFGWFIPKEFSQSLTEHYKNWDRNSLEVHWTHFKNAKAVSSLRPINLNLIERHMYVERGEEKVYYCNSKQCENGWFIPEWCRNVQCAIMLASDFNNTHQVIEHIKEIKVYVQVGWLDPNHFYDVIETYKHTYEKTGHRGLIILSWSPSRIVLHPNDFILVQTGRCNSYNNKTWGCFYEKKRSGVYAWEKFVTDKSELAYELLKSMNFLDYDTYQTLIKTYSNANDKQDYAEIACDWIKSYKDAWIYWVQEQKNVIAIGGIFPISGSTYTGRGIVEGARMAIQAINANSTVLRDYKMELLVADGMCRADKVMKAFIDYLTKSKMLVGVLGPACSETVEPIAGLSKYYKMITISYSAEGAVFSDRDKYPYFLRTIGENKHYKFVYLELLKQLGWKRVAALTEDGQKYTEYIAHLQELLEANDVTFIANIKFPRKREKDSMTRYLEDLKRKRARIIIADVFDEAARNVMCEAYKLGMTAKQGYVWFLPTWLNNTWYNTTSFNEMNNEGINCTVSNMIEAINGHFAITYAYYANDDDVMQENMTVANWKKIYQNRSTGGVSNYAGYAYDGVWTFSLALDKLIQEDPEAIYNLHSLNVTNKLTHIIKHIDFFGVSGRINFRGGTSRFSKINVMQWYNNRTRIVGQFLPNISDTAPEVLGGSLELNKSAIIWLSHNKIPDDGTPPPVECTLNSLAKFLNVKCEMAIIILNLFIIFFIIISLSSVIIVIKKRSKKYEKRVMKTERYMKSLGLQHLLSGNDYIGLDKWEIERECVVLNRKLGQGAFGTVYGGEANLSDTGWTPVAVKTLKMGSSTEQKLDFLSEAEVMKRFDHKNIVKLLGVCTKEEPVYTVMEFMLYGDLKTYLLGRRHLVNGTNVDESEEVSSKKLTSMALDVARGLSYLAELKYVHRDVASRNCLLSGQRVVKLGDFGMTRPMFENDYYKFNRRGMLPVRWMAPESLALGVFTPASDVWSYGVLLYEIITFGSFPFQGLTNTEVLEYVKKGNTITIPQGVKAPLECLLKSCWNVDPKIRPTASVLVEYLANNSRLICPCLDVPLASVQMEDTGQLEMQLPDQFRKCSSSFNNIPMINGISSMSIHTPTRRQISDQGDSGISMQMENCCPKEPLLPPRSDSISECSKYATIQHDQSGCDRDDNEDYYPGSLINGHAISEV